MLPRVLFISYSKWNVAQVLIPFFAAAAAARYIQKKKTLIVHCKLPAWDLATTRPGVKRVWPGDTVDNAEENSQGQDGDQEPGEDDAHHSQAKQHQGQVLQQHFSLHSQTNIHCGEEVYFISHCLVLDLSIFICNKNFPSVSLLVLLCVYIIKDWNRRRRSVDNIKKPQWNL